MSDFQCRGTGALPASTLWSTQQPGILPQPFAPTCEATGYEDLDAIESGPANADPYVGLYDPDECSGLTYDTVGRLPGQQMPMYGYFGRVVDCDGNTVGGSGGVGLDHQEGPISHDLFSMNVESGQYLNGDQETLGMHGDAQVARFGVEPGEDRGPVGVDGVVLGGRFDLSQSDTTDSAGVGVDLISGGITVGDEANSVRFGGGLGLGFGARSHHGDADHNGVDEWGLGIDVGPVSFDFRTELFSEIADAIDLGSFDPGSGGPMPGMNPDRLHGRDPVTGISAPDRDYTPSGHPLWR